MSTDDSNRDRGRGQISPEDREAMRRRAAEIGRRLDDVKATSRTQSTSDGPQGGSASRGLGSGAQAAGSALRFTFELLAGVGVGALVGWLLDRQFNTAPWLMLVFLGLGFTGALVNVIRAANRDKAAQEASRNPARAVRDDDEDR